MNNYSPISRIIVKDFRSIGDVQIDFSESPIVVLRGQNDAGKTSIIKAFEVCAMHYNSRKQADYIRKGAPYFGVVIQLADGSTIIRMKTTDGINKYEVRYSDGRSWTTIKISEGLPVQVSQLMGMIEEPETKEYLQVRTYEDQLLLVYTPASTNYKVIYDALKVGQVTRAVKNGIVESNELKQEIMNNYTKISAFEQNIKKIVILDISDLTEIREVVKQLKAVMIRLKEIMDIRDEIEKRKEQLGTLRLIDTYKLTEINEARAKTAEDAGELVRKIEERKRQLASVEQVKKLESVDTETWAKISGAVDTWGKLENARKRSEVYRGLKGVDEIDVGMLKKLESAGKYRDSLTELRRQYELYREISSVEYDENSEKNITAMRSALSVMNELNEMKKRLEETNRETERLSEIIKESGVGFEVCPNCGTEVVIDYSRISSRV